MEINNNLGEKLHLKRLPGVAIYGDGSIAIFIKIRKIDVEGYYLMSSIDYYSNFYLLDVKEKEIVKAFEDDFDNNDLLKRSSLLLVSAGMLGFDPQCSLKYSDISEENFLKFKKLFDLYQVGKNERGFNVIYDYCNSLLQ